MAEAGEKEADGAAVAPAPAAAPAARSRLKRLLPFGIGALLSAGFALACGFVIWPPAHGDAHDPAADPSKPEGLATPLDQFEPARKIKLPQLVVNLADQGQGVAARVVLVIELRAGKTRDLTIAADMVNEAKPEEAKLYPEIRDALITLFSGKVSTDIKTPNGKELLKLEILDCLSGIVFPDAAEGALTDVYFIDLVVQ